MHFQSVYGLPTTSNMDTPTWQSLLSAVLKSQYNPAAYKYVVVTQSLPQHPNLYINGKHTYTSLVSTGISVAPTSNGTYPVYLRYVTTTMSGTKSNGSKYHDAGISWASYFHGGALHADRHLGHRQIVRRGGLLATLHTLLTREYLNRY